MKIISKEQHKFSNHVHLFTCRQTHQVYWLLFFNKNSMFIVHWYSSPNRNSWIKAAAVLWLFSKYMVHYLYSCMSPVVSRQVLFSVSLFSFSFFSFKGFNLEPSCAIFTGQAHSSMSCAENWIWIGVETELHYSDTEMTAESIGKSWKQWQKKLIGWREMCEYAVSCLSSRKGKKLISNSLFDTLRGLHFPVRDISCSFTLTNYLCTAAAICSESTQS